MPFIAYLKRKRLSLNIVTMDSSFDSTLSVSGKLQAKPTIGPPTIKLPEGWI